MQPHVIVLNGPAGVGKTTVGRCLASLSPDGVCIHGDALREFVVTRTSARVPNGMTYCNGAKLAAEYLHAGYERVVFEFVFEQHRQVKQFLAAFDESAPVFLFTLWASLPTILHRERSRTNRDRLGERVGECYRAIEQELDRLGIVVQNEGEPPERIAQRIAAMCDRNMGIIQW